MANPSKLLAGLKHGPSAYEGLVLEACHIALGLAAMALVLVALSALEIAPMYSIRLHMAVLPAAFTFLGAVLMFSDKAPSSKAAADALRRVQGEEHLALWMGLYRVVALPLLFVLAVLFRRELFYTAGFFPWQSVGAALSVMASVFILLRSRRASQLESSRFAAR